MSLPDLVPIRTVVAVVEDAFRDILRGQLERAPRIRVVGEARDSRSARRLIHSLTPDLLVIECELNRELAVQRFSNRRTSGPAPYIIVIVTSAEPQQIVEAFELGAKSVVLKASLPSEWGPGIEMVIAGQYWIADESISVLLRTARQFLEQPENAPPGTPLLRKLGLTPRETEIAHKIADGRSNKELGDEFSISERTVKHHLTNIFKKAGVSSRLELALLVLDTVASRQASISPLPLAAAKSNAV